MRVAVVSDVHGNLTALEAVRQDLRVTSPDLVVHGGDLVVNGSSPAAVLDLIDDLGWPGVVGNTDEMLWRPERLAELAARAPERQGLRRLLFTHMAPATLEVLGRDRVGSLRQLPAQWANDDIAVVHAAPNDLWRAPLVEASDEDLTGAYSLLGRPIVMYAHIHRPFVRAMGPLTVANSGSVSLSYDGDPRASYAVIEDGRVSIRRVPYDVEREARALKDRRYPFADWLISILRSGIYTPPPSETAAS